MAKLDKIKFAKLVGFCAHSGMTVEDYELNHLDELIDIEMTEPEQVYPANGQVDELMKLMVEGQRKIEAIKVHRAITGMGLKDSKDAVEKYWGNADKVNRLLEVVDMHKRQIEEDDTRQGPLKDLNSAQLDIVANFIKSYTRS